MKRPGDRFRAFAARFVDHDTLTRLVDPTAADLQFEHAQARRTGRSWRVRWIHAMGVLSLMRVCGSSFGRTAVAGWSGDDVRDIGRTSAVSIVVAAVALLVLGIGPFTELVSQLPWSAAVLILPQAIPLALPIGLLFGVVLGLSTTGVRARTVIAMLAIATATSALSFLTLNWIVPDANQAFRTRVFQRFNPGRHIERGANELGLAELRDRLDADDPRRPASAWRNYYLRFALPMAPIAVTVVGLSIVAPRRLRPWQGLAAALLTATGYVACMGIGAGMLPPLAGTWLPNVVCLGAALLLRHRPHPSNA